MSDYLIKLVRDDVAGAGCTIEMRPGMDRTKYIERLRQKLATEAIEYLSDPSLDELADVYEVMRALARYAHGLSMDGIAEIAMIKRDERGGFDNRTGMWAIDR